VDEARGVVTAVRKAVSRWLMSPFSPLCLVPGFREAKQVLRINQEIAQLESASKFAQAKEIRDRALNAVAARFSTPLWRSRGFDLLRLGQPQEALVAFETGIRHLHDCTLLYGVAPPDELYYGAALAALQVGNLERSREYYDKTVEVISTIRQQFPTDQKPAWWDAGLGLVRRQLERAAPPSGGLSADT
jgi:tetratricopeptide (TPR) repeat protein